MKRSRFSEERIIKVPRQAQAGVRVADLCRQTSEARVMQGGCVLCPDGIRRLSATGLRNA